MADPPHLHKWIEHINWWNLLPPGRPSLEHLKFFRSQLAARPISSALVLGSTPELRDLCAELGISRITVIDHSLNFHNHVHEQRVYPAQQEMQIFDTWENALPRFHGEFDAVLADLVSGNVPYSSRIEFYTSIANSLRSGGIFLEKILTNRPGYTSIGKLDQNYADAPVNLLTINRFANEYFFTSELARRFGRVDIAAMISELRRQFLNLPRHTRLLENCHRVVSPTGIWYYGLDWSVLEADYARVFDVTARYIEGGDTEFANRLEIFCSRPV